MPTLNIYQDEQNLAKNILQLRQYGNQYRQNHEKPAPARHSDMAVNTAAGHDLSAREIEVLVLIIKGLINKEIADKTEHQPDYRHLTPQEYHREAGHQVRIRADYLCSHAWICGSRQNIILQPEYIRSGVFQKGSAPINILICYNLIVPSWGKNLPSWWNDFYPMVERYFLCDGTIHDWQSKNEILINEDCLFRKNPFTLQAQKNSL